MRKLHLGEVRRSRGPRVSALLGDGFRDYLSAVALGIPVLACARFAWRRR